MERASDTSCPRCGYDQHGLISAWSESCPLEATCTECGLTYRCADLLVPEKFEPKWCVEHCPRGVRPFAKACVATLIRSFMPWRFWSRLKMSDRIEPRRLRRYVAALVLTAIFVPVVLQPAAQQCLAAVETWHAVQAAIDGDIATKRAQIDSLQIRSDVQERMLRGFSPEERERIRAEAQRDVDVYIATIQAQIDSPPVVEHSFLLAVLEAICLPLADTSFGQVRNPDGTTVAYPAPFEIWSKRRRAVSWWANAPELMEYGPRTSAALTLGVLAYLAFPLTLALLPISRRKAKVRWAHIWRVMGYGAVIPVLAFLLATFLLIVVSVGIGGRSATALHFFAAIAMIPLCMVAWWTLAVSRYMNMPHAVWIALLHTIISIGAAMAFASLCWTSLIFPT